MQMSLMTRSQRMVTGHCTQWLERGDHYVVRTPTNPTFYGGNLLQLSGPPAAADLDRLEALFAEAFPGAEHRTLDWPGGMPEDTAAFEARGYELETSVCLSTRTPRLDQPVDEALRVEAIRSDPQWEALLAFWLDVYPQHGFSYLARLGADFRDRKGPGNWWIAREAGGQVIGCLGLYFGDGLGRFQNVDTHPRYQRLGVCRTLMTRALQHAAEHHPDVEIVIAAVKDGMPQKIYETFGFEIVHEQTDASWRQKT